MSDPVRLQAYLRVSAQRGRDVSRCGPFVVCLHPRDPLPFLNYAVPDAGAWPSSDDVGALCRAFERVGRLPRLEFLHEAFPALAALAREAFADGAELAFLTPGDEDTSRIYARVGFAPRLTALAYSAPAA